MLVIIIIIIFNNIEGYLNLPSDASESIEACVVSPRPPRQAIVLTKTEILSEFVKQLILCQCKTQC